MAAMRLLENGSELFTHALQVTKDNFLARHHLGLALL